MEGRWSEVWDRKMLNINFIIIYIIYNIYIIIKISDSSKMEKSRCQVSGVNNWNNFGVGMPANFSKNNYPKV